MNYSYDSDDNIVNWKDKTIDAFDFFTTDFLTANVLNEDPENRFKAILESLLASDSDELIFICALMNAYASLTDDQTVIRKLQREIFKIQKKWKMRYQQGCKQISQKLTPALTQKNKKQSKTKGISARQVTAIKPASGFINIAKGYNLTAPQQPLLNGNAKLTLENGSELQGNFRDSKLNGLGILTQPDASVYVGNFVNNVPKGEGVLINSSGVSIIGVFDGFDGDKIKDPIIKYPCGAVYKGQVKSFNPNGKGELKFADGKIVIGTFENGIASGEGKILQNGYEYIGQIVNNNANGLGLLHGPDGSILEGFFTENLLQGIGQYKLNDVQYFGEFKENKPQGRGIAFFNDSWLQGTVHIDIFEGVGIGVTENFIYDGEIKESDIQGFGTIYYKDGRIISGKFAGGQLVRPQQQQKSQVPTCNSQAVRDLLKFHGDIMASTPNPYAIRYLTFSMTWLKEQLTSGIYKHCFEFQHIFLTLQEEFKEWNSDPDL
jgi:hypothetical protein